MRIDFARFCILHQYGGIYADMDVYCYKNFYNELTNNLYVQEAPYGYINGVTPVENALMLSEPKNSFWISCMELSCKEFDKVRFMKNELDLSNKNLFTVLYIAGPELVLKAMIKNPELVDILPGILYNNHGLSYHPEYRTKHMLTGMWGKEATDNRNEYIKELSQYSDLTGVTIESFDFYTDYTNGGYLTEHNFNLSEYIKQKQVEFQYG